MGLFTGNAELLAKIIALAHDVESLRTENRLLAERIERGSTVTIRADLDNLTGRVESLAKSTQRQLGAIYAERRSAHPQSDDAGPGRVATPEVEPELDNLLEFQRKWGGGST